MNILLDTHYVIELVDFHLNAGVSLKNHPAIVGFAEVNVSVASLWEVAIKFRIGRLSLSIPIEQWPSLLAVAEVPLLKITYEHVLAKIGPEIATRDPFDRLLLGVCAAESLRLLTVDRAIVGHPLAVGSFPQ